MGIRCQGKRLELCGNEYSLSVNLYCFRSILHFNTITNWYCYIGMAFNTSRVTNCYVPYFSFVLKKNVLQGFQCIRSNCKNISF